MVRRKADQALKPDHVLDLPVWRKGVPTFVAAYLQVVRKNYWSLKEMFRDRPSLGLYRTGLEHLNQLASFFFGKRANHKWLFDGRARSEGIGATERADVLFRRLMHVAQFILTTQRDCQDPDNLPLVRIGASRTIGLRLVPSILSTWRELFGNELRLEVEIGNTRELVERLRLGTLHFILSYGDKARRGRVMFGVGESGDRNIAFHAFDYQLNLILICQPQCQLLDTHGCDRNQEYSSRLGSHGSLPRIRLDDIDFTKTRLIVSSSWWRQPETLSRCVARLMPTGQVQQVLWFHEAIALTRMGLGTAIVSEVYKNDKHVHAFALSPTNEFRKWIGVYYDAKRALPTPACKVAAFIGQFLKTHADDIREGNPPVCSGRDQDQWKEFECRQDWEEYGDVNFPTRTRK